MLIKSTYISIEQHGGFSIRWPFLNNWNNFSTLGTEGYGVPPKVIISHNKIPYDHLLFKKIIDLQHNIIY